MPNKTNHEGISKLLTKLFAIVQRIYNHNKYLKLRMLLVLGYYEILNFFPGTLLLYSRNFMVAHFRMPFTWVSLTHDGTDWSDGTGIQSVSPVPSASVAVNIWRGTLAYVCTVLNYTVWLVYLKLACMPIALLTVVGLYVFYCMVFTC